MIEDAIGGVDVNPGDSERAIQEMREAGAALASSDDIAEAKAQAR